MIVGTVSGELGQMLVLGLSGENVTRLTAGEPILLRASRLLEAGLKPGERLALTIVYGRTEADIAAELEENGLGVVIRDPAPETDRASTGPQPTS